MAYLKEYLKQPKVEIQGRKFVDEKLFIELLNDRFEDLKKDCFSDDEKEGIEMCQSLILNL